MKLSQLFSPQTQHKEQINEALHHNEPPKSAKSTAYLNRQIHSLAPGQTLRGEIVGRNGSEVQIKLSEDMVLNARVDKNVNIEIGKNMTFEVKNNGSTLTLSPLFTNVSTDVNVLKALDMASMPVNPDTIAMTEQLMEAGLPVNKNWLQQVYREINSFPQAEISDIIYLHKLQMPVNEANVNQMAAYRNLSHKLTEGMETILNTLPEVFDSLRAEGDMAGAMKLYQQIFQLIEASYHIEALQHEEGAGEGGTAAEIPVEIVGENAEALAEGSNSLQENENALQSGKNVMQGNGNIVQEAVLTLHEDAFLLHENETVLQHNEALAEESGQWGGETGIGGQLRPADASEVPAALRQGVSRELLAAVGELPLSEEQLAEVTDRLKGFAAGEADVKQLMAVMGKLTEHFGGGNMAEMQTNEAMRHLNQMFSQPLFQQLLNGQLKNSWTLRPEDVAAAGKVEELYSRLNRQLKSLVQALDGAGEAGTNSGAFKAVSNMAQNIDFLQQVNQMYTYVQLPLRLQNGETQGELYVYTNKKRLSDGDGKISALLHLDMENLGPLDVYVTLQSSKVSTKFYVQDEELLDFLGEHMDLLTDRLKKRGYDCSFSMTTRGKEDDVSTEGGLAPILQREKGVMLSQYALDVRT